MSVDPNALTTLVNVKNFLEIDVADYDTVLETLINSLSAYIESQTGTLFKQRTVENEIYDGEGSLDLILKQSRVSSVTSIEYRSGNVGNPTWQTVDSDGYSLYEGQSTVYRPSGWSKGRQNYRVTYITGDAIIPHDVQNLCTRLVSRVFDQRKSQGKTAEAIDGASINWTGSFQPIDSSTLKKYKNWSF